MTAGKGIMHAEMSRDMGGDGDGGCGGCSFGFDLPERLKGGVEPRYYRDLRATEIPQVATDGGERWRLNKVISGKSHGVDSVRDLAYTPVCGSSM